MRFPRAASTCFRPELAPGAIVREEGFDLVNAYVPVETLTLDGDPAPFLDLLARMLPDARDRAILLSLHGGGRAAQGPEVSMVASRRAPRATVRHCL